MKWSKIIVLVLGFIGLLVVLPLALRFTL